MVSAPRGGQRIIQRADFDGNGTVQSADQSAFTAAYNAGSPSADYNGDGAVTSKDLDAFTADYNLENPSTGDPPAPDEVRVGYAGYLRDPVTGYLLARNRWYDPTAGRWVTRDPAGYVDGMDLYLYARDNPTGLVDPLGLEPVSFWDVVKAFPGAVGDQIATVTGAKAAWHYATDVAHDPNAGANKVAKQFNAATSNPNVQIGDKLDPHNSFDATIAQTAGSAHRAVQDGAAQAGQATDAAYGSGLVTTAAMGVVAGKVTNAAGEAEAAGEAGALRGAKGAAREEEGEAGAATRSGFRDKLGKAAGEALGDEEDAHHLVALNSKNAAETRERMKQLGLNLNDPEINGAALDRKFHQSLHTRAYYNYVNRNLQQAKDAAAAKKFLSGLRKTLTNAKEVKDLPWQQTPK